jgi:hypothetical protein
MAFQYESGTRIGVCTAEPIGIGVDVWIGVCLWPWFGTLPVWRTQHRPRPRLFGR